MNLLLCSDLHVRSDQPVCRTDNFLQIQESTLYKIREIALKYNASIIIAGDITHRPKPLNPQYVETLLFNAFKDIDVYFVLGNPNHDLKEGNIDNFNICSVGVIQNYENWYYIDDLIYLRDGTSITGHDFFKKEIFNPKKTDHILAMHKFVSDSPLPPWLQDKGITADDLCKHYNYNIFVTGDNHKSFVYESGVKQLVFNCGCVTRQKLNEKDYKPNVFILDTDSLEYERIYLPDNNPDVISSVTTGETTLERESRIDSFIELVEKQGNLDIDYKVNLQTHCEQNKKSQEIVNELNNIIEECENE